MSTTAERPVGRVEELVSFWWPADPTPSPSQARKHALAEVLRRTAQVLVQLDAEAADDAELDALLARAGALHDGLAALPGWGGAAARSGGTDSSLFERSPFTGRANPLAVPLVLTHDGTTTYGAATYGAAHEGPPGCVHGGHVIAAFDDLLGVAQVVSGTAGMTGTLTVRLHRTTPLHTQVDYEAGVTRREGRKVFAWGRSTVGGQLVAEAEGVFVAPRGGAVGRTGGRATDGT